MWSFPRSKRWFTTPDIHNSLAVLRRNIGHRIGLILFTLTCALFLGACGTTSELREPETSPLVTPLDDLSIYQHVVILDFEDQASGEVEAEKQEEKKRELEVAIKHFADILAKEVSSKIENIDVARENHGKTNTIIISGEITRLEEGSAAARFLIGFGAGSSYFAAIIRVSDSASGAPIGTIKVDKNSWALGGGIASGQTVESFMTGAGQTLAAELKEAGLGASQ